MNAAPGTTGPARNEALRTAMRRFTERMDGHSQRELSVLLNDQRTLLLAPVGQVDLEDRSFNFTTARRLPTGWMLRVFTQESAVPTDTGADIILAMPLLTLIREVAHLNVIGITIDNDDAHSVTAAVIDDSYTLYGTRQLERVFSNN
jgi:hypothetical protein